MLIPQRNVGIAESRIPLDPSLASLAAELYRPHPVGIEILRFAVPLGAWQDLEVGCEYGESEGELANDLGIAVYRCSAIGHLRRARSRTQSSIDLLEFSAPGEIRTLDRLVRRQLLND